MTAIPFFFTIDSDGRYVPSTYALGRWAPDMLNGPAVCAAVARSLENDFGDVEFVPARITIELFKAARDVPLEVVTREVRAGRRIHISEADVRQGDTVVAQATLVQLRRAQSPPGQEWHSEHPFDPPEDGGHRRWYGSDDMGWSQRMGDHQNGSRKRVWAKSIPTVENIPNTPFVHAVMTAEATSLVTNWGSDGIGYINCDLTVALSRLPEGERLGLVADTHIASGGISVGTATIFDRLGPIGTGMVTAVSNAAAQIDFSGATDVRTESARVSQAENAR